MKFGFSIFLVMLVLAGCNSSQAIAAAEREYEISQLNLDRSIEIYERESVILGALTACEKKDGAAFRSCGQQYNFKIKKLSQNIQRLAIARNIAASEYYGLVASKNSDEALSYKDLANSFEFMKWTEQVASDEYVAKCWLSELDDCSVDGKTYVNIVSAFRDKILEAHGEQLKWEIAYSDAVLSLQIEDLSQTLAGN